MTITELKKYLTDHLVPSKLYQIGGAADGKICMDKRNGFWEVFFCEKDHRFCSISFQDEQSACVRMLRELSKVMEIAYDKKLC